MYDYNKTIELNPNNAKAYVNREISFIKQVKKKKHFLITVILYRSPILIMQKPHSNKTLFLKWYYIYIFTKA